MLAVKKTDRVLDQLYISPSAQRRGVGKALLRRYGRSARRLHAKYRVAQFWRARLL